MNLPFTRIHSLAKDAEKFILFFSLSRRKAKGDLPFRQLIYTFLIPQWQGHLNVAPCAADVVDPYIDENSVFRFSVNRKQNLGLTKYLLTYK
jgi:hypothetical protein